MADSHLSILFTGKALHLKNIKSFKGASEVFNAVSGNSRADPIPAGRYWMMTNEIHKMSLKDDWTPKGFSKSTAIIAHLLEGKVVGAVWRGVMLHMSAWGEYRIPIRQSVKQREDTGRTNMFIHGGDSPGSAGCIDLGDQINIFVAILRREHKENEPGAKITLDVVSG